MSVPLFAVRRDCDIAIIIGATSHHAMTAGTFVITPSLPAPPHTNSYAVTHLLPLYSCPYKLPSPIELRRGDPNPLGEPNPSPIRLPAALTLLETLPSADTLLEVPCDDNCPRRPAPFPAAPWMIELAAAAVMAAWRAADRGAVPAVSGTCQKKENAPCTACHRAGLSWRFTPNNRMFHACKSSMQRKHGWQSMC